jgi:hypothetical protein
MKAVIILLSKDPPSAFPALSNKSWNDSEKFDGKWMMAPKFFSSFRASSRFEYEIYKTKQKIPGNQPK